jgi:hypothetical protein
MTETPQHVEEETPEEDVDETLEPEENTNPNDEPEAAIPDRVLELDAAPDPGDQLFEDEVPD